MPLALSYGKTAHTFQGQTVGPVQPGQPPNIEQKIVIDPGSLSFEGQHCGLFYMLFGRGTTLGTENDKMSSSMYFQGSNMSKNRITKLWLKADGKTPFLKAQLRRDWINYLKAHRRDNCGLTQIERKRLFEWAQITRLSRSDCDRIFSNSADLS